MKLKEKHQSFAVRLTDEDGETMEFASVRAAAKFLDVSRQAVLQAARLGGKCRGCKVEKLRAGREKRPGEELA